MVTEADEPIIVSIFRMTKAKPLPTRRNPLAFPVRGDVLRDENGEHWIVFGPFNALLRYFGDYDEAHVAVGGGPGRTLSPLEKLVVGTYWKAVVRFPWLPLKQQGAA